MEPTTHLSRNLIDQPPLLTGGTKHQPPGQPTNDAQEARRGFDAALRRAYSWRVPPQWTNTDWRAEVRSLALVAAWQAQLVFQPVMGRALCLFVQGRVLARLLTCYRQEWRAALRTKAPATEVPAAAPAEMLEAEQHESRLTALEEALDSLPVNERWLLDELYRCGRSQEDIGKELGISQPAVHKRKRLALEHLRLRFEEQDRGDR